MRFHQSSISGVLTIESESIVEKRGSFMRLYCQDEMREILGTRQIVQINHSHTRNAGAVRGLHYQNRPHAEMKLVRCIKGRVWDVAVDLRAGSPTFLQYHAEELSPDNRRMIVIPEGCAHGFQVMEPDSQLLYLHTDFYARLAEGGIHATDTVLSIAWPLPVQDLSERDSSLPTLTSDFTGLTV